jgi:hypothetical protein
MGFRESILQGPKSAVTRYGLGSHIMNIGFETLSILAFLNLNV